jgi:hypothetical protein
MPYDRVNFGNEMGSNSVMLQYFVEPEDGPKAVCRHQALYTQVLLQAFGMTSRLLKCYLGGGAHAANLVRINYQWHILDTTNDIFEPIEDEEIDLNNNDYTWCVESDGAIFEYISRKDMYFRIKPTPQSEIFDIESD